MAGYECSLCGGEEQPTLLITPLTGGDTMAVGPGCMGVALLGMTAGHFEIDADKLKAAVERLVNKAKADAAKQPPESGTHDRVGESDHPLPGHMHSAELLCTSICPGWTGERPGQQEQADTP